MSFWGNLKKGIGKDLKTFSKSAKQPSSNFVDSSYDLGQDIGQKVLFLLMILVGLLLPSTLAPAWFLVSSILGYLFVITIFKVLFNTKSEKLRQQENAKRFLAISPRIWNYIVGLSLAAFFIIDLFKNFDFVNLGVYPFAFIIAYGLLTKNATVSVGKSDPNRMGSSAWFEANGIERVLVNNDSSRYVYRDKNGNYYEKNGLIGQIHAIPAPVEFINKK